MVFNKRKTNKQTVIIFSSFIVLTLLIFAWQKVSYIDRMNQSNAELTERELEVVAWIKEHTGESASLIRGKEDDEFIYVLTKSGVFRANVKKDSGLWKDKLAEEINNK